MAERKEVILNLKGVGRYEKFQSGQFLTKKVGGFYNKGMGSLEK